MKIKDRTYLIIEGFIYLLLIVIILILINNL